MAGEIVVVGSANQDLILRVPRLPAPGETLLAHSVVRRVGGKGANQAAAAARLGGKTRFIGCVGDDEDGGSVLSELWAEGVDVSDVEKLGAERTGLAVITVTDEGSNSITVVPGANSHISESRVRRRIRDVCTKETVIVIQAEIEIEVIEAVIEEATRCGSRVVFNLAPYRDVNVDLLRGISPLVLNEVEIGALVGEPIKTMEEAVSAAKTISAKVASVVVTMGPEGACWVEGDEMGIVRPPAVARVVDTTGAGDALVGAMANLLSRGASLEEAVEAGVAAGSYAVQHFGAQASYATADELVRFQG